MLANTSPLAPPQRLPTPDIRWQTFYMENLPAFVCLTVPVLHGSAGMRFALPPCADTAAQSVQVAREWNNCFGTIQIGEENSKYTSLFENGRMPNPTDKATQPMLAGTK